MFAVVEFPTERSVSAVPMSWITVRNTCRWPTNEVDTKKLIQNLAVPRSDWREFNCVIKKRNIRTFPMARKYERMYEIESEIESEMETSQKRRRHSPSRLINEGQNYNDPVKNIHQKRRGENGLGEESTDEEDRSMAQRIDGIITEEQTRLSSSQREIPTPITCTSSTIQPMSDPLPISEIISELRLNRIELENSRKVMEKVLLETKKQNHYLRRLVKEDSSSIMREVQEDSELLTCHDGQVIPLTEIKASDPKKFAIEFTRRMKGVEYLASHILEPNTGNTEKIPMERDFVKQLKKSLSSKYERYSWNVVKEAVNRASRDAVRKIKKQ